MTRRGPQRLAGALTLAALLLGSSVPATRAAPNPYGDRSTDTTVVLHPDGSYDVTMRQTQELVREFQLRFGGGVHDGFRLPDDGALLPPYLRAAYTLTSVTVAEGQPSPERFTNTNHLVSATSTGTYPAGRHTFEISYRVTGAAVPSERGWTVHLRLLDGGYSDGDRVQVRADDIAPRRLTLRCVTFAPDSEPCGIATGFTVADIFEEDRGPGLPPEFLVEVEADNTAVPTPTIDRR